MLKRVMNIILSIIGFFIGVLLMIGLNSWEIINLSNEKTRLTAFIGMGLLFALIFYLLSSTFLKKLNEVVFKAEAELTRVPTKDLIFGSIGLLVGLMIAYFLSMPVLSIQIPVFGSAITTLLSVGLYFAFGYLGIRMALRNKDEITQGLLKRKVLNSEPEHPKNIEESTKILDTSVIIDGRIIDIIRAGFIEGVIVIPTFVLEELQHIADSSDNLRRSKGRRGLDILKEIQEQEDVKVEINPESYDDIKEVDSKLLSMAKDLKAAVITNDYNLNKVAGVRGIKVLNINELANAVKPVVIPGEEMNVTVIKDGKEANQGLSYLSDGTMIVVEDGKRLIGQNIDVVVTSVLQTSAGKMIFAKPK